MGKSSNMADTYRLSNQVGFNLRRANQRHVAIFSRHVDGMTPTQFATLARLYELGPLSQNKLGRMTAMDSATIKGVVERLMAKNLLTLRPDQNDQRLRIVELTEEGQAAFEAAHVQALRAREETLEPLTAEETETLEAILAKLV
tara:strand:+ start:67 stop:498 length:432 start_codon:yes stop_codon:yes gene_type:complete